MPSALIPGRIEPLVWALAANGAAIAIKVTLVIGLATLFLRFDRRASGASRSLIASIALHSGVLIPLLSVTGPEWTIPPSMSSRSADVAPPRGPGAEPRPLPAVRPADPSGPADIAEEGAAPSGPTRSVPLRRAAVMFLVALEGAWAAGLAFGLLHLLRDGRRIRALIAGSDPVDPEWLSLLEECRSRLSLRQPVSLRFGPGGLMPATTGIRRPVILLPRDAADWPEPRRRAVLLHELAHVKRRDVPMQVAERLCCLLHWFNPLVRRFSRIADLERERACDDRTLAAGVRVSAYAEDLLKIALSGRRLPFSPGLGRPADLGIRIEAILSARPERTGWSRHAGPTSVVMAIALLPVIAAATLATGGAAGGALPPFSMITSELPITVVIEPGDAPRLSMEGDPAEIARIRPEVIGGELLLRHDPRDDRAFSWREDSRRDGLRKQHFDVTVRVTAPGLTAITNRAGRGRIETATPLAGHVELSTDAGFLDVDVECAELRIRTRGSGVVTVRGIGETAWLNLEGGIVQSRDLSLARARVRADGGVCEVGTSAELDVRARGSAAVSYRGHPAVTADLGPDSVLEPGR